MYWRFFSPQQALNSSSVNALILVECPTLTYVVTSAAESETAAIFHNPYPIYPKSNRLSPTNKTTCDGQYNNRLFHKNKYHTEKVKIIGFAVLLVAWLTYIYKRFKINWKKSSNNLADYFTKHFLSTYHKNIRSTYAIDFLSFSDTDDIS